MKYYLQFSDGQIKYLPNISEDLFEKYIFSSGSSDIEYNNYLIDHSMLEPTDVRDEIYQSEEVYLIIENDVRKLVFKCIEDLDK